MRQLSWRSSRELKDAYGRSEYPLPKSANRMRSLKLSYATNSMPCEYPMLIRIMPIVITLKSPTTTLSQPPRPSALSPPTHPSHLFMSRAKAQPQRQECSHHSSARSKVKPKPRSSHSTSRTQISGHTPCDLLALTLSHIPRSIRSYRNSQ